MASIWLLDGRDVDGAGLAACAAWLGPSERQRLAGFARGERRRQFVLGRALLRAALAPLLAVAPAAIALAERRGNAPLLDVPGHPLPWFSLSHSGPWIACAVSARTPVGLDIERLDAARDLDALAAQVFDAAGQAALAALAPAARVDLFYRMWSTAEARFKLGAAAAHTAVLPHPALSIVLCSAHPLARAPGVQDGATLLLQLIS
jgi:4'-phosphopantetheinyl transferase